MHCIYPADAIQVQCTCKCKCHAYANASFMQMPGRCNTANAKAMHVQYKCDAHAIAMQCYRIAANATAIQCKGSANVDAHDMQVRSKCNPNVNYMQM